VLATPSSRASLRARAAAFSVDAAVDRYESVLLGLVSARRSAAAGREAAG
jgi:hypothetical protein